MKPLTPLLLALAIAPVARAQYTTFSTIATSAYATGDINSCAIQVNNLTTVGNYQFAAYYDTSRRVVIARRTLGSSAWTTFNSGFSVTSSEITDDHNVIAIAVDSAGYMHLSWNMHNQALNYATSNLPVTTASLPSLSFTKRTSANAPTLFPSSGVTTNSVTYPAFYPIPNSADLLFTYRNGGAGGGSGNGDQYFNVYSPSTGTWTNRLVINGQATSVNAYLNSLAYTSDSRLLMSWTWRATPNWQTNSNIMFAQSPDNGTTWTKQNGTPYTLPIIQSGTPATSVAEVVKAIPQNSSFINQTSMTVDPDDNPYVATYYAPISGNPNRQYMLEYYDGAQWRTSQVTNRTSDTAIDTSGSFVRDLGRPVVLTDPQGRVLVVTRSEDTAMGASSSPSTTDNEIVIYYNTVDSLRSASPGAWKSITLDTANMGTWEPTYDHNLWDAAHKLSLFYQPVGLGSSSSTLKILDWDEQAFFANLSLSQWAVAAGGAWSTPSNWTDPVPNAVSATANFSTTITQNATVTLAGATIVGTITFDNPTYSYTLAGGSLVLNNGPATAASVSVQSGSHTISSAISLPTTPGVTLFTAGSSSLSISGNLTGTGSLTKTGNGTLILSGNNTYAGPTTVSAGTLRLASAAGLSPNSNLSLTGGLLELTTPLSRPVGTSAGQIQLPSGSTGFSATSADASVTITSPLTWGSATFDPSTLVLNSTTAAGNLTLAADINLGSSARTIRVNSSTATLAGALSGTGPLQFFGPGTLVLSSPSTYTGGTTLTPGIQGPASLRAAANSALGTGTLNLGPTGNSITSRLELIGNISLPNAITFTGRTNSSVAIENLSGNNTLAGELTLTTGGNVYQIQSDAGSLTLSAATAITSTATGSRVVTLQGNGDGAVTGNVMNGSATLSLTKSGPGTWTLSGSNSYTGITTVTAGALVLSGPAAWSPVLSAGGADLRSGRVVFDYASASSPLTDVRAALASGQIGSTTADSTHTLGYYDDPPTARLTVLYALTGDANLDGILDADDFALLDRGLAAAGTAWSQGDFNHDGAITPADYFLIDSAYLSTHPASPGFLAIRESQFGPAYVSQLLTAIPEPLPLSCVPYPLSSLLLRRRKT